MSLSVVFLKSAEQDVKELKHYVIRRFGVETWQSTLSKLKESIHTLQAHPQAGMGTLQRGFDVLGLPQGQGALAGGNTDFAGHDDFHRLNWWRS